MGNKKYELLPNDKQHLYGLVLAGGEGDRLKDFVKQK